VNAVDAAKVGALPGVHAFSGADVTGRFAHKGKLACWQALGRCSMEVISAFAALGTSEELGIDTERVIETFVCQLCEPGTTLVAVGDLRWKLFTKKQLEAHKLPPTRGALHEAVSQAHYQAMVWYQDDIPHPQLPPATNYGWKEEGGASPSKGSPAPTTAIHLIKCNKSSCRSHCSCRSQRLNCSVMCMCGADEEICCNVRQTPMGTDDDEDEGDPSI